MDKTTLEIKSEESGNLAILLDALTDGDFKEIANYNDIAIQEGSSAIGGVGDRPVLTIEITFDKLKPETIETLVNAFRKICGDVVSFKTKIK